MRDNDLIQWAEGLDVALPSGFWGSLAECNRILHPQEQRLIMDAVHLMRGGLDIQADVIRGYARYDCRARREDRERRGLPCRLPPTEGATL